MSEAIERAVAAKRSERGDLKYGVGMRVRYDLMRDVTQAAEELGFESVWLPEHLIWPVALEGSPFGDDHPPVDPRIPTYDVLVWMVMLATATSKIRLGTYVYNLALRSPFVAARAVQTLDIVSNGRVEFGIGAGWSSHEYEAVGIDFASRGRRLDECIEICRRLWIEEKVSYDGEFFSFEPVYFEPKPVQQPVPILIGGESTAALRRAARIGDGWIGMGHSVEEAASFADRLRKECAETGRTVQVTCGGSPRSADEAQSYADAGVDRLIVSPWRRSADAIDGLRRFAEEVMGAKRERAVAVKRSERGD